MKEKANTKPFYNTTIPSDWEMMPLSSLGKFSKGKGILKEQVIESGLPCIRYGEIYTTHDFILKEFKSFISEEVATESKEIKKGDVLFAGSGETLEEIGKAVAYVGDEKAYAGGDVIILSTIDKINTEWLSYILESDFVRRQKRRLGQGHSVVHIYPKDLATLKVPSPPEAEQESISNLLDLMDTAINKNKLLIEKKELQKKWLMQNLLTGKKRLKGFKGEWKEIRLGDVGQIVSGGTPSTTNEEYWNGNINWCTPTDITKLYGEIYIGETVRKITEAGFKNSSANLLPVNSVIVCTRATVGACAINKVPMTTNQGFKSIIPQNINYLFLYYKMLTLTNELISLASGSTFLEISKSDFEDIYFKSPSLEEQTAIAQVLQIADKEIELLKARTEKLREEKKGMVQVLLTGRKRLKIKE